MTISNGSREAAAALLAIALAIASWWFLPHADPADYAKFADDPFNARNVYSNAGFLIAGIAGLCFRRVRADAAALTLFVALIATSFGSAYFHLRPVTADGAINRWTLLWDRLPMTFAFAGMITLVLQDRVRRVHGAVLPVVAAIGVATVFYWFLSRSHDLFPYALFQLFAPAGTLLMITILRPRFTEAGYVVAAVFLFGMAKAFEDLDDGIFARWHIGGHPLKHITGALAAAMILLWLTKRSAIPHEPKSH
ncbi:MAG TPA: hypothetical protein VM733_12300 [Thermoanaerobaculia bacterium]|nr:hypothetical protein [Thermoanaerobaculia bacterium]